MKATMPRTSDAGKPPHRFRRLPMRPGRESRTAKCAVSLTAKEKRKVEKVASEVFEVSFSELVYYHSIHRVLRMHDEVYGNGSAHLTER